MTNTLPLSPDELLTTTRAVRKRLDFDRPVSLALVKECLEIALQAPTGSNAQGWQWMVVQDPAKRLALAQLYRKGVGSLSVDGRVRAPGAQGRSVDE